MSDGPGDDWDWTCFGPFAFSLQRRELRLAGRPIPIGERGMHLLSALLSHAGQPVSKAQLIEAAWGQRAVEPSNLTVQIAILRRQLEGGLGPESDVLEFIRTLPGYGYVFNVPIERPGRASPRPEPPLRNPDDPTAPTAVQSRRPEPLTRFIGRERERRDLAKLLGTQRLVTVAGFGGVGKTRLALRLRDDVCPAYPDGVTFVDLAPLADPHQMSDAVATALGVGGGPLDAMAALAAVLSVRRHLLILDNAEHLVTATRQLVGHVLERCPQVSVLVTSRDTLGLPGEVVFRLAPLDVPPSVPGLTSQAALRFDSVRLLVDRAQNLLPDFAIDDDNAGDIAELCRLLDGIALAIEMAVPRLEVLTARQLRKRLVERFDALANLRHDVPPRQRTLRAMFDWSWQLLSDQERRLLQVLAIPGGGCTLDALETLVRADGGSGTAAMLEQLTRLAQSSLVIVGRGDEGPRYGVLETTRQYALEQLTAERLTTLSRLHASAVADLFEQAETEWPVTHGAAWLARFGPEADNLRWALQWAFGRAEEHELALRLVAAGVSLWWELPELPLREARGWYAKALAAVGPATPPVIEARLLFGQSWTDTLDDDVEHYAPASRAVALFHAVDDRVGMGAALWRAASTVLFRDHKPSAAQLLDEARRSLAGQPAAKWRALCQVREADLLLRGGEFAAALQIYDEALVTMRRLGHAYGLMVGGGNRSYALFGLGRTGEAIEALRGLRTTLRPGLAHPVLSLLTLMLATTGQDEEAREVAVEGLAGTMGSGLVATLARTVEAVALVVVRSGEPRTAARLLGFALAQHSAGRARLAPRQAAFDRLRELLGAGLTPAVHEALLSEGAGWSPEEALQAAIDACQAGRPDGAGPM